MTKNKTPSILFWGTSEFALPSLEALVRSGFDVSGVVTTPDKPAGRKLVLTPSPIKILASEMKIPVYQPETLRDAHDIPEADLFIVAAYGKIIPKEVLDRPRLGSLNIHPSLLPRWRGPSPIQFTILAGDQETGVSIIKMDEVMDHGPIVAVSRVSVTNSRITYPELHDELAKEAAKLMVDVLPQWTRGEITPTEQDHDKATFSKILSKEDGKIDWRKSAVEIERQVRAFTPWPGSWTTWNDMRLRIDEADILKKDVKAGNEGFVTRDGDSLYIQAGENSLLVKRLTLEGEKTMSASEFLKGHPDIDQCVLK